LPGLGFHGLTLLGGDHIDDPEPGRLRWQDTPDEQDPLAKRKINCHRTSSQDLNAYVESAECSEAYSVLVLDKNDTNDLNSFNCTEYEPFILFGILLKTAKHIRTYLALEGDGSESKDTKFEPVADHLYWSQKQDGEKTTFMVTHVASALRTAALNRTSN